MILATGLKTNRTLRTGRSRSAFTLLELILVMTLTLMVLAGTWPNLSAFSRHQALNAQADSLLAMTRCAFSGATASADLHLLIIDPDSGRCRVVLKHGSQYQAMTRPSGMDFELPPGVTISVESLSDSDESFSVPSDVADSDISQVAIKFRPDGSHDTARITLTNSAGDKLYLYSLTALESFRISDQYERTEQ